ncbi:MAG: hypothetical protein AB1921_02910 [Thermodesulfobacteriota bacterium]
MARKSVLKKEWLLVVASVALTLVIALGLIRYFAPQLLGIPVDLRTVQVAKEVPPFFDNIFRPEDFTAKDFIIEDPYIVRAKPLFRNELQMGPNDILGFRNRNVPCGAEVITIGDSQTYGNTTPLEQNWPSTMQRMLKPPGTIVYNMSCGAWAGVEYLEILKKALYFKPKVVVVAYYTGNDSLGSFLKAYGNDHYKDLRLDPSLSESDAPKVAFPPPRTDQFRVVFSDGVRTVFTPKLRHSCNEFNKVVDVGYEIMARTAEKMAEIAGPKEVKMVFTIIPTKEYAYEKKMKKEGFAMPPGYMELVNDERKRIQWLSDKFSRIPGAVYADVAGPLQEAALDAVELYPHDGNGHPVWKGYEVIATALAPVVQKLLPKPLAGPVGLSMDMNNFYPFFIAEGKLYGLKDQETLDYVQKKYGKFPFTTYDDINLIPWGGTLDLAMLKEKEGEQTAVGEARAETPTAGAQSAH